MTIVALNRCQGRAANDGGMFFAEPTLIDFVPEAQEILARVGAAICPFSTVDRVDYARRVAAVALDAKRSPRSPFARATL